MSKCSADIKEVLQEEQFKKIASQSEEMKAQQERFLARQEAVSKLFQEIMAALAVRSIDPKTAIDPPKNESPKHGHPPDPAPNDDPSPSGIAIPNSEISPVPISKGMKGELPIFTGANLESWLLQAERYFLLNDIQEEDIMGTMLLPLDGDTLDWYLGADEHIEISSWCEFRVKLQERFNSSDTDSAYHRLKQDQDSDPKIPRLLKFCEDHQDLIQARLELKSDSTVASLLPTGRASHLEPWPPPPLTLPSRHQPSLHWYEDGYPASPPILTELSLKETTPPSVLTEKPISSSIIKIPDIDDIKGLGTQEASIDAIPFASASTAKPPHPSVITAANSEDIKMLPTFWGDSLEYQIQLVERNLIAVNAIACFYSLVSIVLWALAKGSTHTVNFILTMVDMISMILLFTGLASASGLILNFQSEGSGVCKVLDTLCAQVSASIAMTALAGIAYLLLDVFSFLRLHLLSML